MMFIIRDIFCALLDTTAICNRLIDLRTLFTQSNNIIYFSYYILLFASRLGEQGPL